MSHSTSRNSPLAPILVPVDFEPAARSALITGARLAMSTGAPLKILHVVHEPADKPSYYERRSAGDVVLPIDEVAGRMLQDFLLDIYRRNPELENLETPDTLLVHGLPCTRIPEVASLVGASQVVIGQHRTKGILGKLFALPSERIANRCDVPVTIVYSDAPPQHAEHPPQLVPVDGGQLAAMR
jgi:nucleotide-binding universal stress UspA family protein